MSWYLIFEDKQTEIQNDMKTVSECQAKCSRTDRQCPSIPSVSCRNCAKKQCGKRIIQYSILVYTSFRSWTQSGKFSELAGTRTRVCLLRNMRQTSRVCPTCGNLNSGQPSRCTCASSCLAGKTYITPNIRCHHCFYYNNCMCTVYIHVLSV